MVEIRYGEQYEVTDLAGLTVSEAREKFRAEYGIPDKATARLNGNKVKGSTEPDIVLNDDDRLSFAVSRSRGAYLVGALLLALAVTGGVFAAGFINASTTLNATGQLYNNFAEVTENTTGVAALNWNAWGYYKGSIDCGPTANNGTAIFNIDTSESQYTGDLVVTVSYGNAAELVKVYRVLALKLGMCYANGAPIDINESSDNGTGDVKDWVILSLDNGSVSMFPQGWTTGSGNVTSNMTTVRVKSGFYITHVKPFGVGPIGGWKGTASPDLFCEVAQR